MGSTNLSPPASKPPKVSPPRNHEGVVWTRLQEGLEKCANSRRVWLYAGPGAGKTQGVRKWLAVRNEPFAWFQVDANDHDPIRVMYYLQHAVSALPLNPQLLTRFNPSLHSDIRVYAEHWFRQIDAVLDRPGFWVLDDLHLLGASVMEHPVFSQLLSGRFERLCVLVVSRSSPESQGVVQNGPFATLGPEHFALGPDEIRELLLTKGVDRTKLSRHWLDKIAKSSGGWVAAVRLLKGLPGSEQDEKLEYDELLFRLMKSELLSTLPLAQQRVFRSLSYLSSFSTQTVDLLDPSGETRQTVLRYCHENQFVDVLEFAEPPSLRFHPLLRETLQRVEAQESPLGIDKTIANVLTKTALDERRFADALELMMRVEDWDAFVHWVSYTGLILLERGERASLKALLDRLPQSVWDVQHSPRLRLLYGGSMVHSHPVEAMNLLEQALQACLRDDIAGLDLALTICLGVEAVLAAGQNAARLMPFWKALDARHDVGFGPEIPETLSFRISMVANLLINICAPRSPSSARWTAKLQEQGESIRVKGEDAVSVMVNLAILTMTWASHGYPEKAEILRPTFERLARANAGGEIAKMNETMVEFSFALVSGHFPRAFELYDQGAGLAERLGSMIWTISMTGMASALAASVQDIERVQSLLASVTTERLGRVGASRFTRAMIAGTDEASRGNIPECVREFKLARDIVDSAGHRMMGISSRCALSAVHAQIKEFEASRRYSREAQEICDGHGVRVGYWSCWAAQAYLALQEGDHAQCHHLLAKLLGETKEVGYFTFPTSWTGAFSELLCEALEAGIEVPFVRAIISRNERYSRQNPRPHEKWPAKYNLVCLGEGSLCVDGVPFQDSFVPGNGLYELVMTLMWLGGRDVADHRVMGLLWPGKAANLKNPLHQSLKRLRQNFKRTQAVIYDSGRLSLHPGMWKVDIWEIERSLEQIVRRCLNPQALDTQERHALEQELSRVQVRCDVGFASESAMPVSLRGRLEEEQGGGPLLPEHLLRSLSAAKDALRRI